MIILVHNGENTRITWRDAGAHVRHHSRHKDVTGALPRGEGASLPLQRDSHDFQLRRGEAVAVTCLKGDSFMRGNPKEVPCRREG